MKGFRFYPVKEEDWPARKFIIQRSKVPLGKMGEYIEDECSCIYNQFREMGVSILAPPCAFIFSTNEIEAHIGAAVLCEQVLDPGGFETITVSGKVISTCHMGYFNQMDVAYQALEKYLLRTKQQKKFMIEEYLTNPLQERNPAKWKTNIYYLIE